MNINVQVEGGFELREILAGLPAEIERRLEDAISDEVDETTTDAQQHAPVDTGALRDSIEGTSSGLEGQVEVGEHYGTFVEFGTTSQPSQPFMLPASEQARQRLPKRIADAMGDLS